jgi:hypothetical protein
MGGSGRGKGAPCIHTLYQVTVIPFITNRSTERLSGYGRLNGNAR